MKYIKIIPFLLSFLIVVPWQLDAMAPDIPEIPYAEMKLGQKKRAIKSLGRAAAKGDIGKVRKLLDLGVDVNSSTSRSIPIGGFTEGIIEEITPLMYAAKNGHLDIVRELLRRGADFSKKNDLEKTALIYAIQKRKPAIVYEFVIRGLFTEDEIQQARKMGGTVLEAFDPKVFGAPHEWESEE